MNTCPNCGAGNKQEATACRMCGASLEKAEEAHGARMGKGASSSSGAGAEHQSKQEASDPVNQAEIECPNCKTVNEAGWAFCQQCGKRLPQPQPPQPSPVKPSQAQPPAQSIPPTAEQNIHEGFTTVPTEVPAPKPSAPPNLKTVVAQPPVVEPNREVGKPIPAAPPTVVAQPPVPERKAPERKAPERKAPERKAPPASKPDIESFKTVVAEQPPVFEPPLAHPPVKPEQIHDSSRGGDDHSALTEQVLAASTGTVCPQCDHVNVAGNAYCANCGAIISVAKTVVMSSPPAEIKGSLHLVMEGGQSGEVYELDEETVIGRAGGDVTFPHDGFMSGRHARIVRRGNRFILTDEGSRNGTFIKIKGEVELKPGDMILVGKQLFRFEA
jgi:hypothetical protein